MACKACFIAVAALGAAALAGCISPQEMLARHKAACTAYGFTPGTEAYANCLLQLEVGDYGYGHHRGRPVLSARSHPASSAGGQSTGTGQN